MRYELCARCNKHEGSVSGVSGVQVLKVYEKCAVDVENL